MLIGRRVSVSGFRFGGNFEVLTPRSLTATRQCACVCVCVSCSISVNEGIHVRTCHHGANGQAQTCWQFRFIQASRLARSQRQQEASSQDTRLRETASPFSTILVCTATLILPKLFCVHTVPLALLPPRLCLPLALCPSIPARSHAWGTLAAGCRRRSLAFQRLGFC